MSAATTDRSSSSLSDAGGGLAPEQLWDLHGTSLYAMACVLLGEKTAALRAVTLGMVDLYRSSEEGPPAGSALRSAASCVFRRCRELRSEESMGWSMAEPVVMARLGDLAVHQRRIIAMCTFGGHTYSEAAGMLDLPADTVARLLSSGLHELTRLAPATGSKPVESHNLFDLVARMKARAAAHEGARKAHLRAID